MARLHSKWVGNVLRYFAGAISILDIDGDNGLAKFYREVKHQALKSQTRSANFTADLTDCGYATYIDTDGVVVTLPATTAGATFTFINAGADAAVAINISPNASDKIQGVGLTAADNKDLINTKATAKKGDLVRIIGDGTDGWIVQKQHGTWAREA